MKYMKRTVYKYSKYINTENDKLARDREVSNCVNGKCENWRMWIKKKLYILTKNSCDIICTMLSMTCLILPACCTYILINPLYSCIEIILCSYDFE